MRTSLREELSNSRMQRRFFDFFNRSIEVKSDDDFKIWLADSLSELFPYEMFCCGVGQIQGSGLIVRHHIGINFPDEYLDAVKDDNGVIASPIFSKWLKEREPQLFEALDNQDCSANWLAAVKKHQLRNVASHGLVEMNGRWVTYFSFHRIPEKLGKYHSDMLKLLVPHLHQALARVVAASLTESSPKLTPFELRILRWLRDGRSDWEIGQISNRSRNAVRQDIIGILEKLDVTMRFHAAPKAVELGLIPTRVKKLWRSQLKHQN